MYLPIPMLVAIAVAFLVFAAIALRRRGSDRDLIAAPRIGPAGAAQRVDLPPAIAEEIRALKTARRKIQAIKKVREATGLGLAEAKDLVERL